MKADTNIESIFCNQSADNDGSHRLWNYQRNELDATFGGGAAFDGLEIDWHVVRVLQHPSAPIQGPGGSKVACHNRCHAQEEEKACSHQDRSLS